MKRLLWLLLFVFAAQGQTLIHVGGSERWGHFLARTFRQWFAEPFSLFASCRNGPRRQGFASPRLTTARP